MTTTDQQATAAQGRTTLTSKDHEWLELALKHPDVSAVGPLVRWVRSLDRRCLALEDALRGMLTAFTDLDYYRQLQAEKQRHPNSRLIDNEEADWQAVEKARALLAGTEGTDAE